MVDVGAAPIDRYVVLEHLSEGGMGAIYVGKKLGAGGFEMQVVLKQLLPEFTQQEEFIDLFLREAKLSATLDHANIVHTIDLVTAGNEYFIVMEYLPGGDLRTLLRKAKRRGKRFSPSASIHICREVLSALAYAHVKRDLAGTPLKLIHRDVSPSNILVSYAGEVKLTDFGIAKAATHNSLFYKVKGKIGYMSPEQAKSEPLDHRSDLYSLAVCMYEALTGERLFVHAGLTTSADEIYSQPVPQVSRKIPGLTTDLDAIMNRALALSPDDRYQTAGEFQEALTRCAHRNGLLMSAPEVALELLDCCGEPEQWRDDGTDDEDLPYVRAGTEVLESGAEEDDHEAEPAAPAHAAPETLSGPVHGMPSRPAGAAPMPRTSSSRISRPPKTEQHKLQGVVELTSIINMIDLENQHREAMAAKAAAQAPMQLPPDEIVPRGPGGQRPMRPQGLTGQPPARGPGIDEGRTVRGQPPVTRAPADPRSAAQDPRNADPRNADPRNADPRNADPRIAGGPRIADPRNAGDPRDALPTVPRPRSPRLAPVPQLPAPVRYPPQIRRRGFLRPWMVIVAILLAAAVAGVVIAMSGPDVAAQHGK